MNIPTNGNKILFGDRDILLAGEPKSNSRSTACVNSIIRLAHIVV